MILLLFPAAFIPMVIALILIRNIEKYKRESWAPLIFNFAWGAIFAAGIVLIAENFLAIHIKDFLILSVVFAPIIEEFSKPLALKLFKKEIDEIEDGLIYGAVAGLGFAATENLIYGIRFWDEGLIVLISLFYLRTLGSSMLHASATALTGYGYSKKILQKGSFLSIAYFFLLAVGAHSLFNLFSFSAQTVNPIIGVVVAVLFAVILMMVVRNKIIFFDVKKIKLKITPLIKKV